MRWVHFSVLARKLHQKTPSLRDDICQCFFDYLMKYDVQSFTISLLPKHELMLQQAQHDKKVNAFNKRNSHPELAEGCFIILARSPII
jgi:hypothetical protein